MAKTVWIHPGTLRTGYVCPDCCTPSVIVVPYYWLSADGVTTAPANTVCTSCKRQFTQMKGDRNVEE
jgi:hypothetical protein